MAFGRKPPSREEPGAYERGLRLLSRREHSRVELARKLKAKGVEPAEATQALGELTEARHQSDERFAEVLVRQRVAAGYGPRHIQAELRSHGIANASVQGQLGEVDWHAIARALVERRYARGVADTATRNKAAQFLTRRGFTADVVAAVTRLRPGE